MATRSSILLGKQLVARTTTNVAGFRTQPAVAALVSNYVRSNSIRSSSSSSRSCNTSGRGIYSRIISKSRSLNPLVNYRVITPPSSAAYFSTNEPPKPATNSSTAGPDAGKDADGKKAEILKFDDDEYDDYEEPKTRGEKVWVWFKTVMILSLYALGAYCVFLIGRELFPGRLSPNSIFSEVFELLRVHDEVKAVTGEPMTAFGRDVGTHTEGRRNNVDSRRYKADDGSNRTRVRFNVKGPKGKFLVWAEVSDKMPNTEFVYLILQDTRTGRVLTIHDNRNRLEMEASTGGGENNPMMNLLGYGRK